MSEDNKNIYSGMSTEKLEELLRLDLMAGGNQLDEDATIAILEILDEREQASGIIDYDTKTQELWQEFKAEYLPYVGNISLYRDDDVAATEETKTERTDSSSPAVGAKIEKKQKRSFARMLRVAVIALVMGVLLTSVVSVTTYAAGYDIWGIIAQWANGTFRFVGASESSEPIEPSETPSNFESNGEYSSLQDALDSYNITEPLAPKWLPEDYSLVELSAERSASGLLKVFAAYTSPSGEITILIEEEDGTPNAVYESDDGSGSEYSIGGTTHYLMTNLGMQVAVWINGNFVISIVGDVTRGELIDILHSVYE